MNNITDNTTQTSAPRRFWPCALLRRLLLAMLCVSAAVSSYAATDIWDGSAAIWTHGTGTDSSPYLIESAAHLAYLASATNSGTDYENVYFQLTTDIHLADRMWTPIGSSSTAVFKGHFNGNFHTIEGLYISSPTLSYGGLFGHVDNAVIQKIAVHGNLNRAANGSNAYGGGIVGYASGSTISDCCFTGSISATATSLSSFVYTGGIAGYLSQSTVTDCYNISIVSTTSYHYAYVGGVAGYSSNGNITRSYNIGTANANAYASSTNYIAYCGGIAGYLDNNGISLCYNTGALAASATSAYPSYGAYGIAYAGGCVGYANGICSIAHCYNTGHVTTTAQTSYSGGLSGAYGIFSNSYNAGTLTGTTCGGISALGGNVTNCHYRDNCGGTAAGGTTQSESQMKSAAFPTTLNAAGTVFVADSTQLLNQGYPIFADMVYILSLDPTNVKATSVTLRGVYASAVDSVGFEYKVADSSTYTSTLVHNEPMMTLNLSNLADGVEYTFRAFVWSNGSIRYGQEISFLTLDCDVYGNASTESLAACDSLLWHGVTYRTTTHTSFTTTNAAGCDSVANLTLTINHSSDSTLTVTACGSYAWHGNSYSSSTTTPTFRTQNAARCDSVVTLHLTVNNIDHTTDSITACDQYAWHGNTYTTSTSTPVFTYQNALGCDSIITLHLTVNHASSATLADTACDSYAWHGNTYTNSTVTPRFDTLNAAGCDSTVSLHLTINRSNFATFSATACDSYAWHGSTYTASTLTPQFDTLNAAGCDSTTTLHLNIRYSTRSTLADTACNQYTWHGSTYTTSTTDTVAIPNAAGCDSVITLHLTISNTITNTLDVTACDRYEWYGNTYASSTTSPTVTLHDGNGCDSILNLHLTINHSNSATLSLVACDSLRWHDSLYTAATDEATHTATNMAGCDSVITLQLTLHYSTESVLDTFASNQYTWNGTSYSQSGTYALHGTNAAGCDSTITMNLVIIQGKPVPLIVAMHGKLLMLDHTPAGLDSSVSYDAYRWYRDGELIDGATRDYYAKAGYQPLYGSYYLEVPADASLTTWVPSNVIVIDEEKANAGSAAMSLSPNPVRRGQNVTATCCLSDGENAATQLAVYDLQGRQVYSAAVSQPSATFQAALPTGAYTVVFSANDGTMLSAQKMIVQ